MDEHTQCNKCGMSPRERKAWEAAAIAKYGWYAEYILDTEHPDFHTHGFRQKFKHLDFQIVMPNFPSNLAMYCFHEIARFISEGNSYKDGDLLHDNILDGLTIKLFQTKESGRPVLRMIMPDKQNRFDREDISYPYRIQYEIKT